MKKSSLLSKFIAYTILGISSLLALFPIYWAILTSLRTRISIFAQPPKLFGGRLTLDNYRSVLEDNQFKASLIVTITITLLATFIAIFAGTLAAYGISRRKPVISQKPFEAFLVLVRAMPGIVLAVPLYKIVVNLGFYDNPIAMAVVYAGINLPFAVWLITGFVSGIPNEIEESARVDGASQFTIIMKIIMPLLRPGLAATSIFVALLCWNEFLMPLVLADQTGKTLPVYVAGFVTSRTIDYGAMAAAACLSIVPIMIFTLVVQRQLIRGLSLGAVKD